MSNVSKKAKKRQSPTVASAAGLVRFFEETDLKIALKPHLIIIIGFIFVAIVVAISKLIPPM